MAIDIVVATDASNGIGKNGKMPWHFKKDFTWFKNITSRQHLNKTEATLLFQSLFSESLKEKPLPTTSQTRNSNSSLNKKNTPLLLMGHSTWLSINRKPLKKRMHVVVTKKNFELASLAAKKDNYLGEGSEKVQFFASIEEALSFSDANYKYSYAVGGESIYTHVINKSLFRTIYLTKISATYPCDRFFHLPNIPLRTTKLGCFSEGKIEIEVLRSSKL